MTINLAKILIVLKTTCMLIFENVAHVYSSIMNESYYLVLTFLIFALAQTIRLLKIDSACGKTKGGRYDYLLYTVPTKADPYAAHVLDWPTVTCDKRVNTFVHIQTISDPARLLD